MMKKMRKKIPIIVFTLLVAVGALSYWYWQKNVYSRDILKLEILGPESVDFAKDFNYTVKYKNNGKVRLEEAKLIFEYPGNSIIEDGKNLRQEITLEDIYPGEEKTFTFSAKLIGQEGEVLTANASLSYKPKNLNARYESSTSFTTQIKSLPLTFEFDLPSKVETGKDIKFRLNYFSNVDYPLMDLRVEAEYPSGFEFVSSVPKSLESVEWELSPLNKAEGGRIEIIGRMQGTIGEQKLFKAKIGMWRDGEFIVFKEIAKGVGIIKPGLLITQKINGSSDYTASPGEQLHYEIYFKNISDDIFTNLSLADTLSSPIFDLQTINAPDAGFAPGDNSIVWDWRNVGDLQYLSPDEENKVEFWIKLKSTFDIPSVEGNLTLQNTVYLAPAKETFTTKVNSKLELVEKAYFQDEIFGNSGPIPPQIGTPTTYTINWQVKNYYNKVGNVKVKTVLPSYVQLTGKIFPEDAKLTFDSQSREIVWDVGDVSVGQGILNPAPNVSFQVSLVPSSLQAGTTPDIISQIIVSGEDAWTNDLIESASSSINTASLSDDSFKASSGIVH
jgi:uncharacterized repeat protein (TIGR01451 family)